MAGGRLEESVGIKEELIKKACSVAMKAHKPTGKLYIYEKTRGGGSSSVPDAVFFVFPGSWSVDDWVTGKPFGEKEISLELFPSLRSIGNDQVAVVNNEFFRRFEARREKLSNDNELQKAVTEKKQIVFTGHSSGGSIAMLATLWFLENYPKSDTNQKPPLCITFGSPLIGDKIFPHVLSRENWSHHFLHFVMRYDIVPRISLAPFSANKQQLQNILNSFNPKTSSFEQASIRESREPSDFYMNVMRNASSVASHAACNLMGCTNLLLETVTNFIELSPYKPFGTYVFCTGNGNLVVVKNPDAVLQLLFYCLQLSCEAERDVIACRSLTEHLGYEQELQESMEMQTVVCLDHLEELPMCSNSESGTINSALNDLGLSTRARLSLRAAGVFEKRKKDNQTKIDANKGKIKEALHKLEEYQVKCEVRKVGYFDAFKLSKDLDDFHANVRRLELAGMWDELIEMLKRYELPDGFEVRKEWIELGTKYRHIVEPLDIANYYRHLKNEDTGPYIIKGRPKRYRYTQRWLEYAEKRPAGSNSESCFWAEIEEQCIKSSNKVSFWNVRESIKELEEKLLRWVDAGELSKDVFLEGSTFFKWWNTLPQDHRSGSRITEFMQKYRKSIDQGLA